MKFPTVKSAIDVFNAVDSDAVVTLLSKMGDYLRICFSHVSFGKVSSNKTGSNLV